MFVVTAFVCLFLIFWSVVGVTVFFASIPDWKKCKNWKRKVLFPILCGPIITISVFIGVPLLKCRSLTEKIGRWLDDLEERAKFYLLD